MQSWVPAGVTNEYKAGSIPRVANDVNDLSPLPNEIKHFRARFYSKQEVQA